MKNFNLKTKVGKIVFSLKENHPKENWFDFDVKCIMEEKYSRFYPQEFLCSLHYNDLIRLIYDLEKHCHTVKNDEFNQHIDYMPLEADFQLMLYDGGYENGQGSFTIAFMINMGILNNDGDRSYFGFQTSVDFHDMQILCKEIRELVGASEIPIHANLRRL